MYSKHSFLPWIFLRRVFLGRLRFTPGKEEVKAVYNEKGEGGVVVTANGDGKTRYYYVVYTHTRREAGVQRRGSGWSQFSVRMNVSGRVQV